MPGSLLMLGIGSRTMQRAIHIQAEWVIKCTQGRLQFRAYAPMPSCCRCARKWERLTLYLWSNHGFSTRLTVQIGFSGTLPRRWIGHVKFGTYALSVGPWSGSQMQP